MAMKLNPGLKILLTGGYYDMATPFYEGWYEMHHLKIPANLQKNIEYHYYESGHMVYAHQASLKAIHDDVAAFIGSTEAGGSASSERRLRLLRVMGQRGRCLRASTSRRRAAPPGDLSASACLLLPGPLRRLRTCASPGAQGEDRHHHRDLHEWKACTFDGS